MSVYEVVVLLYVSNTTTATTLLIRKEESLITFSLNYSFSSLAIIMKLIKWY